MNSSDTRQRFLFDGTDIRGEISTLESSYLDILSRQNYPSAVGQLLGEFLTAASLLSATLKFPAMVSIQVLGQGPVKTMMAECFQKTKLRGIVRGDLDTTGTPDFASTSWKSNPSNHYRTTGGERYQKYYAMDKDTLGECLEGALLSLNN